jgi:hypothetical protein
VVASNTVLDHAGEGVLTGGITSLEVRAKNVFMDVAEIVGIEASEDDKLFGMATLADRGN